MLEVNVQKMASEISEKLMNRLKDGETISIDTVRDAIRSRRDKPRSSFDFNRVEEAVTRKVVEGSMW